MAVVVCGNSDLFAVPMSEGSVPMRYVSIILLVICLCGVFCGCDYFDPNTDDLRPWVTVGGIASGQSISTRQSVEVSCFGYRPGERSIYRLDVLEVYLDGAVIADETKGSPNGPISVSTRIDGSQLSVGDHYVEAVLHYSVKNVNSELVVNKATELVPFKVYEAPKPKPKEKEEEEEEEECGGC